eukprot:gene15230-32265_t
MTELLDDVAPKATGKDALIEKRREKGAKLHGAAKDAEDRRDGLDMKDSDVFGGGEDFQSAKARFARGQNSRQTKQVERAK